VKRIIFSQHAQTVDDHTSVTDYKRAQFGRYKDKLIQAQKQYANFCDADYMCLEVIASNYDDIQFHKLHRFEMFSYEYDEVLYLDLDVVPQTKVNFFEHFNLDSICGYAMNRGNVKKELYWKLRANNFDVMNVFSKSCCKSSMLLLEDIIGNDDVINTGVLGGNKKSIQTLDFNNRLKDIDSIYEEAKEDSLYPEEIVKSWRRNNEVFISYAIEKYNVPFTNIGMPWNFMLDSYEPEGGDASHFLHHINKEFERSFE
jgi:hypothetical protein